MLKVKNKVLIFYITFIFIISLILRYKLLFNNFVLDDFTLVVNNSFISDFSALLEVLNPKNLFSVLPIKCGARPFTVVSLIIDYQLFHLTPLGYHLTNLILHSINTCLLFLFCYNLKKDNGIFFPLVASLFYSLHPIQTEVVSTVSFRADLLLSTFSLISLNFISFFKNKDKKFFLLVSFCFAIFAFFSKENAIVLPIIFFIYAFCFYKNTNLLKLSGVTFVSIIFLFFFFWIERFPVPLYFSMYPSLPANVMPLTDITSYISTLFSALFYNILHVVYPINLSADYIVCFSKYIIVLMILFVILVVSLLMYIKDKYIKFSIFALIVAYLPISNLIPLVNTIADRYMYYPMIFVSILFGLLVLELKKYMNPKILTGFIILLFVTNTTISYERGKVYNNQYTLYFDAVIKNPNHPRALYNMAVAYYDNKEYEKSLDLLENLRKLNPSYNRELVWFIMGKNYKELKDNETAKKYYMKAFLISSQNQEFLDEFISMFPSVDSALYYLLNNTKTLDDEIILSFQQYQKSKNTVEIK